MGLFFANDSQMSSLEHFLQAYVSSSEWAAIGAVYGFGPGTYAGAKVLNATASSLMSDTELQTLLSNQLNASGRPLGIPDSSTIYTFYIPRTTDLQDAGATQTDCAQGVEGYHNQYVDPTSGQTIVYAVILRCPMTPALNQAQELDYLTQVTSHEYMEACTDPDNVPAGYYYQPPADDVWHAVFGATEIGDMCELLSSATYKPADLGFMIQSVWSNKAAINGQNPCQPTASPLYFGAAAVVSDTVRFTDPTFQTSNTPMYSSGTGVKIPVGQSKTIQLKLFSTVATTAPWTVSASDLSASGSSYLNFSLDKTTGQNGDVLNLTITVIGQDPTYLAEPFTIRSVDANGNSFEWPVMVGQ